jgi:hypothetical protein
MDRIRGGTLAARVVHKTEWNPRWARLLKGCEGLLLKMLTMNEWRPAKKRMLTKVTKLLPVFSQPDCSKLIVGLISQHTLGSLPCLIGKPLFPQSLALAGCGEIVERNITQNGYAS